MDMGNLGSFMKGRFGSESAGRQCGSEDSASFSTKKLLRLLLLWMLLWTLLPSLCIGNVSIDIAENVAWGQNFDWGYDKNPYFGAWFTFAVFKLVPTSVAEFVFYWLSQLAVFTGLFSVHLLAREIFKERFPAFISVLLLLLIPFASISAYEFNDDVLCIPLYGLTALFFYRGVRRDTLGNWLAFGLFAGLAVMTKYLAGVLLLSLGILLLATKEGRACLKHYKIYLGALLCALIVLPNIIWLFRHDFIAVTYALGRAELDRPRGWDMRIENFFDVWGGFLIHMILPILAMLLFRRGGDRAGSDGFDRRFALTLTLAPIGLSSLFALTTGGQIMTPWTTPYYLFVTLAPVMFYRPCPGTRSLKFFTAFALTVTVIMALAFGFKFLYRRPYRQKRHCNHNVYPGRASAAWLTAEWRKRFGTPCPYVIGRRKQSCNMCYYSPDHPRAFFNHDPKLSPWIDLADVKKRGAVIVWHDEGQVPGFLRHYDPRLIYLEKRDLARAVPAWLRHFAPEPPKYSLRAALLPPE